MERALKWLQTLLQELEAQHGGLTHTVRWCANARTVVIQTDACPTGLGGFLMVDGFIAAYWYDEVSREDQDVLGVVIGDPAYQSELELLAVLISLHVFSPWLHDDVKPAGVIFRADNTSTLMAALELRGKSMLMAQLAAEVALQIEAMQLPFQFGQHVPGIANDIADSLSRISKHGRLPAALRRAQQMAVPQRGQAFYRSWQQSK